MPERGGDQRIARPRLQGPGRPGAPAHHQRAARWPRPAGDIAGALGVSQPNVSRHLAILRDRGFVTTQRFGSSIHYALASPKILRALDLLR